MACFYTVLVRCKNLTLLMENCSNTDFLFCPLIKTDVHSIRLHEFLMMLPETKYYLLISLRERSDCFLSLI